MDPVYGEGPWTGVHVLYSPVYLLTFPIQEFAKFESSQLKSLHSELIKVTYPIFFEQGEILLLLSLSSRSNFWSHLGFQVLVLGLKVQ